MGRICSIYEKIHTEIYWENLGKRPSEWLRHRWEYNNKMVLKEVGYDTINWIHLAQYWDYWQAQVRVLMNLRVS